ncbi:unnamed protein product [Caenorhabditis brenneri]
MPYCTPDYHFSYFDSIEFNSLALHISGSIGIPFHVIGAYCILLKTPKSMDSVKLTLLNFHVFKFFMDMFVSFMMTPYILAPTYSVVPDGLFQFFGVNGGVQCWLMIMFAECTGIAPRHEKCAKAPKMRNGNRNAPSHPKCAKALKLRKEPKIAQKRWKCAKSPKMRQVTRNAQNQ